MNIYSNNYNLNNCTTPVWEGNISVNESFLPLYEKGSSEYNGVNIDLLYKADEVICVKNAALNIEYIEGKDFFLTDGGLFIPAASNIKITKWNEYNTKTVADEVPFKIGCTYGGFLLFGSTKEIIDRQYVVTYRHLDKWQGIIPIHKKGSLPLFHKKLKNHESFTFGFLGDSITTGSNSSGRNNINIPPYIPSWPEVICETIEKDYSISVNYVNKAVGGTASRWGADSVNLFSDNISDIFLIAFGMNDASGRVPKETFINNIKEIADKMIALNPNVEFVVVSTSLPNELASEFYRDHAEHEALLYKLAEQYGDKMVVAPVTGIHTELLKKKKYWDMTGNNVNHPNDYLSCVYAQTILSVII